MSSYESMEFSKRKKKNILRKKKKITELLQKHQATYMMINGILLTVKGALTLNQDFDYVQQKTVFNYNPVNKKQKIEDFTDCIKKSQGCIKLLHSHAILSDSSYFKFDYFIGLESFLVYIDNEVFQVDPMVFSMNGFTFVIYELIDFETGVPLDKNDVLGMKRNYNLKHIRGVGNFNESFTTLSKNTIPELIYNHVNLFLSEVLGMQFNYAGYSFIHNTLVLSDKIKNVEKYFLELLSIKTLPQRLKSISTTDNYQYYVQDGASVVTNFKSDNIDLVIYNALILEAIKMYIYLFQLINVDLIEDRNKVIRNDMYLTSLFFSPKVPIETHNLLDYVYETKTCQNHNEAIKLKLSYMTIENEVKKNRNAVILNILLYIISLLGALGSLETLESQFGIPFKYSFSVLLVIFGTLGILWGIIEYRHNKRF